MKIGIDARIFKTGIGRYVRNLIQELEKVDPPKADKSKNEYVIFLRAEDFDKYQPAVSNFSKIKAECPPYSFKEQLLMPLILTRSNPGLVHFTNFNVPIFWWGKYVLTIHDLIHQEYSTFGSTTRNKLYYLFKKFVYLLVIRCAAFRASKIIVPSQDAKNDVVKYLWVKPEKVVVTYEGLDERLESGLPAGEAGRAPELEGERVLEKYGIEQPYLLYVATMYPHKNHRRLIEAFEELLQSTNSSNILQSPPISSNLQLVLVGKVDYFSTQLKNFVEQKGLSDKIIFPNFQTPDGYLPDEDLAIFYANAAAYVFPSLKEGFGIPILEAWSFGVPVAAANTSSLPEVGGDAVLYFDPYDVGDMVEKIQEVLIDASLRQDLIQKGHDQLKLFSWQKMVKETLKVYRDT